MIKKTLMLLMLWGLGSAYGFAQTPPTLSEAQNYQGLFAAVYNGDIDQVAALIKEGTDLSQHDSNGRSALHIAAFQSHDETVKLLVKAGVDINALDNDFYDVITIAAVANDIELTQLALTLGGNSHNITSPYDGTALIAAAHLGHLEVVNTLIHAKAPLDHVNNLGWTALIEAVILGDGGKRHTAIVNALIKAGANINITDREGLTPLDYAKQFGYSEMVTRLSSEKNKIKTR
ncbi:MAG: ankyrin repeat domain-containing protein [Cellvibrionaceae bacterium]